MAMHVAYVCSYDDSLVILPSKICLARNIQILQAFLQHLQDLALIMQILH